MKKSLFIVLAISLFISGCNTVSLIYSNADRYLQHKIYGYTSFNARQKKAIAQDISDYMIWHRKNALPQYIQFLQNLNGAAQYDGRLSNGEIALLREQLLDLYKKTLAPAVKPSAEILSSLDSKQIGELEHNLAEENKKIDHEELEVSEKDSLDKRADRTVDFLEWLAGDLSREQEQKVREMSRDLPFVKDIYIRQREANQRRLISLLNDHASEETVAAFLSSWLWAPEATRSPQQQQTMQSFDQASDEMIARIHGLLTDRQKDHIHKKISSYIDDMRAEIRKAGESSSR
jgi:hypothetical protein